MIDVTQFPFHVSGALNSTKGDTEAGSNQIIVSSTFSFKVNQGILIRRAGVDKTHFVSKIVAIDGKTITLRDKVPTSIQKTKIQHDDTEAIQEVINWVKSSAKGSGLNGVGNILYFPAGLYNISSTLLIAKNNIILAGEGVYATKFESMINDDSPMFKWAGSGFRLQGGGLRDLTINGISMNALGIAFYQCTLMDFQNLHFDKLRSGSIYTEELMDSTFFNCFFRGGGKIENGRRKDSVHISNSEKDNSNRLQFISCNWEASQGAQLFIDSSKGPRGCSQNTFAYCKFHGVDPNNIRKCPEVPHIIVHGDSNIFANCFAYLSNADIMQIKGDYNRITETNFSYTTKSAVTVEGDYNIVTDNGAKNIDAPVVVVHSGGGNKFDFTGGVEWKGGYYKDNSKHHNTFLLTNKDGRYLNNKKVATL